MNNPAASRLIMWRSVFLVVVLVALVAESRSKIHPLSVHKTIMEKLNVKRQTTDQDDECVEAKLNKTLPGTECEAGVKVIEQTLDDAFNEAEDNQVLFNLIFQLICIPECGNVFLQAAAECETFLDEIPGSGEFFVGLCANNQGTPCYTYFDSAINASIDVAVCYSVYQQTETCQCEDELKSAVESQGCCLTVYQNFVQISAAASGFEYNPNEVYGYCNVRNPGDCSNSPLILPGASVGVVCSISAIAAAVLLALAAN